MSAPKLWRGQTLQDRSSERREQILDVGEQLLGAGGAAAVTMRAVTREANLSPRYFYESFATRDALIIAVYDRLEARLLERLLGISLDGGLRATLREVFDRFGDFFDEDPRRARILLREPLADDTLHNHSVSRTPTFIRAVIPLLGAEAGELTPPDDEDLAIAAAALSGALVSIYLEYADGRLVPDRDRIAQAAVEVVVALSTAIRTDKLDL